MAGIRLKNDELNVISYDKYFGEMDISEEEKEKRKQIAKELEDAFFIMFYLLTDSDIESVYKYIQEKYCEICRKYISSKETPTYIVTYSAYITKQIIDSVKENFVYNADTCRLKSMNIAANEANVIGNYINQKDAVRHGFKYKVWKTKEDKKVRHTHVKVDGKKIGIFDSFKVGNSEMMFPKDYSLGAHPEEIVNCRCVVKYEKS